MPLHMTRETGTQLPLKQPPIQMVLVAAQTGAVKFGGANGKSEVVTATDGKTYCVTTPTNITSEQAVSLKSVNTDKTENPLFDAALAQVTLIHFVLTRCGIQNRFKFATANPQLQQPVFCPQPYRRFRLRDRKLQHVSRADSAAGRYLRSGGTTSSAKRPLYCVNPGRLIHRHVKHNQGSESHFLILEPV